MIVGNDCHEKENVKARTSVNDSLLSFNPRY